ncbi:ribonuclease D [Desulfacinum hydrothermale DSM 13146]|uniref:Ribonuclease D n=1 Tax=Desulfacinum hydrothermale DSM 13146 TaxID=1121390 RepID=A0A1W1XUS3_9BACT|nr:HRDC domain-containing protein [Desulfacinum hydrothermale]SMC27612.1 ribonuclease D [Desulfacinum hydrothermale DSM 13146]
MRPYILIDSDDQLQSLIPDLHRHRHVAVDTESNGYYAYYERVCLIQISTSDDDYILDTLALRSTHLLGEIFRSPSVEKILHAAANDIGSLKRDYSFEFQNVFDTALACKILGEKRLGLAGILADRFQVQLEKKWQRCDWGKRPLKPEQLHYARLDTHFLIALRHQLHEELVAKGLAEAAQEAFRRVCLQAPPRERFPEDGYRRIRGVQSLSREALQVLQELYAFRDREARRLDRAPFRVLSNEALLRLAKAMPTTQAQLNEIKALSRNYRSGRPARRLLQAVRRALDSPPATQHAERALP